MRPRTAAAPLILLVPGLGNSGAGHWQTHWEAKLPDSSHPHCLRVVQTNWDQPEAAHWVSALAAAIDKAHAQAPERPVLLAAHSLGCHTVAWWAQMEPRCASRVAGALLVAPPAPDFMPNYPPLAGFAPAPLAPLPIKAKLVASRNDPYADFAQSQRMAQGWAVPLLDAGALGHINAQSDLGDWPQGMAWLLGLLAA